MLKTEGVIGKWLTGKAEGVIGNWLMGGRGVNFDFPVNSTYPLANLK
jgi:hypothetical protein